MKKLLSLLLVLVMTASALAGCAGQGAKPTAEPTLQSGAQSSPAQTAQKEKVVIACWGNQMLDG